MHVEEEEEDEEDEEAIKLDELLDDLELDDAAAGPDGEEAAKEAKLIETTANRSPFGGSANGGGGAAGFTFQAPPYNGPTSNSK
jgi:hypothetical protein